MTLETRLFTQPVELNVCFGGCVVTVRAGDWASEAAGSGVNVGSWAAAGRTDRNKNMTGKANVLITTFSVRYRNLDATDTVCRFMFPVLAFWGIFSVKLWGDDSYAKAIN